MDKYSNKFTELLSRGAVLAPMAGYTDSSFRGICAEQGAVITVTEMVSAKALRMGDKLSLALMKKSSKEGFYGIQLFGTDPEDFAYAAEKAARLFSPDFIDINMGCPAPKITGSGAGSKLMTTPETACDIVRATVSASGLPVSCKIRSGFKEVTAPSLSPMLEQAGASCIFVHARTRDKMYAPPIDPGVIADVKNSVSIPVVGNGDITTPEEAVRLISETGCDGIMIGRGSLGDPFLFRRVADILSGNPVSPLPSLEEKLECLLTQTRAAISEKGEFSAMREIRKHTPNYIRGVNGAAALRARAVSLEVYSDLEALCRSALEAGMSSSSSSDAMLTELNDV